MRREHGGLVSLIAAAALQVMACSEPEAAPPEPLPPGDGLPAAVEAMIYGSSTPCRDDDGCSSGICTYGSCIGVLLADQRWMHTKAAGKLRAAVDGREELRPRVVAQLERVARSAEADDAYRSRAIRTLEALGASETLMPLLADPEPRLSEEAAIALVRAGREEGLQVTLSLARSDHVATSAEALRALGHLPGDAALVELLANLTPGLEPALNRAALDGLRTLNDPRAARPIAAAIDDLPGHLRHRAADALRSLTGAQLGTSSEGWAQWLTQSATPVAPEFQKRVRRTHEEEGLPAPY